MNFMLILKFNWSIGSVYSRNMSQYCMVHIGSKQTLKLKVSNNVFLFRDTDAARGTKDPV